MAKTPETDRIHWVVSTKVVGQIAWFLSRGDAEDFLRMMQDSENVYSIEKATR